MRYPVPADYDSNGDGKLTGGEKKRYNKAVRTYRDVSRRQDREDRQQNRQGGRTDRTQSRQGGRTDRTQSRQGGRSDRVESRQATAEALGYYQTDPWTGVAETGIETAGDVLSSIFGKPGLEEEDVPADEGGGGGGGGASSGSSMIDKVTDWIEDNKLMAAGIVLFGTKLLRLW